MEEGIEDLRSMVFAESKKNLEREEVGEGEERKERENATATASELVKSLIVNFVPGNGGGGRPESDEKSGEKLAEDGKKGENQKEGGIINNLISNLVSSRSCPATEADQSEGMEEQREDHGTFKSEEEFERGGGEGIINNLISNIFQHDDVGGQEDRERGEKEERAEGGGGGNGIVELISNLPRPLTDGTAPATDEASILIHSIVHD